MREKEPERNTKRDEESDVRTLFALPCALGEEELILLIRQAGRDHSVHEGTEEKKTE